nr:hypothetical protein 59 [Balneolaceae bacterium]
MGKININFHPQVASSASYLTSVTSNSPATRYDEHGDVLYIDLAPGATAMKSELDDEEIFVFSPSEEAEAIRFAVPFFQSYWRSRLGELLDHLAMYAPSQHGLIASCLLGYPQGTVMAVFRSYRSPSL